MASNEGLIPVYSDIDDQDKMTRAMYLAEHSHPLGERDRDLLRRLDPLAAAHMVVFAALRGQLEVAKEAWFALGGVPIRYTTIFEMKHQPTVVLPSGHSAKIMNGDFGMGRLLKFLEDDDIPEFMSFIHEVSGGANLKGNTLGWPELLRDVVETTTPSRSSRKVGEMGLALPRLTAEAVIEEPGLLAGLERKAAQRGVDPGWFDDILIWASDRLFAKYPEGLNPLMPVFNIHGDLAPHTDDIRTGKSMRLGDPKRKLGRVPSIKGVDFVDIGFRGLNRKAGKMDEYLLSYFQPHTLSAIEASKEGFFLCRTTVGFLKQFERDADLRQDQYDHALDAYMPLHAIAMYHYSEMGGPIANSPVQGAKDFARNRTRPGYEMWPKRRTIENFLGLIAKHPCEVEAFRRLLPEKLGQALTAQFLEDRIPMSSLPVITALIGKEIERPKLKFSGSSADIDFLSRSGYVLPDGADIRVWMKKEHYDFLLPKVLEFLAQRADGCYTVNGLVSDASPEQILDMIAQHLDDRGSHVDMPIFLATAKAKGFEFFEAQINTEDQWRAAYKTFGVAPLQKHIAEVPDDVATKMATSSFDF